MARSRRPAVSEPAPASSAAAVAAGASSGTISARTRARSAGLVVILIVLLAAVFADVVAPHAPTEQYREAFLAAAGLAGGRLLARSCSAPTRSAATSSRAYLRRPLLAADRRRSSSTLSLSVGIVLGLVAGFARGWVETLIMRLMDIILALPSLLLAIVIVAILGPGLINAMIAVAIVLPAALHPPDPRLGDHRAVQGLRRRQPRRRRRHAPADVHHRPAQLLAPLIVQATLGFSNAILDAAALGFLGLGAQPPTPEWGTMLADAREFVLRAWWVVTFPGLAILITVLAFNLLGDGLRDALDPKLKRS